jgi:hypothetical protein
MRVSHVVGCLVLLSSVGLVGCGGGGQVPITPAEGVIKINGVPAENLLIQLTPVANTNAKVQMASAVSKEGGKFFLESDEKKPGAPVGKHKVIVIDNNFNVDDDNELGKAKRKATPKNRIPQAYSSASTPLELVIETGKKEYEINVIAR